MSCGSGGGCHWTMMDWFVRPLATIFFGGALGASSLSINLTDARRKKKTGTEQKRVMLHFIGHPVMRISVLLMSGCSSSSYHLLSNISINTDSFMCRSSMLSEWAEKEPNSKSPQVTLSLSLVSPDKRAATSQRSTS